MGIKKYLQMTEYTKKVLCEGEAIELESWYVKRSDLLRALVEEEMELNEDQQNDDPVEIPISKSQLDISIDFMNLVDNQMQITKKDFKCGIEMANMFFSKFDEDTIVELYNTCNFLGLQDLY